MNVSYNGSNCVASKADSEQKKSALNKLRLQRIGTPPEKAVVGTPDVYCTGCEMCVNLCPKQAITMKANDNGFFYPEIDSSKCIDCGICHKSCPAVYNHSNERNTASSSKEIYALRSSELNIRKNSSSGGAFVHLSDLILDAGGVVYGCKFNEKFEAVCGRAENKEQRDEFRGAKYIQSRMHDSYKHIEADLRNGRKVMFSGVPCQVDAVKTFLTIRKVDTTNLYTVELICHGCPSPVLWKEHLADLSKKYKSKVKSVTFRAKDSIGNAQALLISFDNGKTYFARSGHDDYYRLFLQNTTLRPSCFSCRYAKEERVADITLGDWWGGNRMRHEFTVDHMGCSQVHVNTDKGKQLFDALDKDKIEYFEISEKQAFQPNLRHPTRKNRVYDSFWTSYIDKGFNSAAFKISTRKEKIQIILQKFGLNEAIYKLRHR